MRNEKVGDGRVGCVNQFYASNTWLRNIELRSWPGIELNFTHPSFSWSFQYYAYQNLPTFQYCLVESISLSYTVPQMFFAKCELTL